MKSDDHSFRESFPQEHDALITEALRYAACSQDLESVKEAILQGADINAVDEFGWTALMWAIDMVNVGKAGDAESIVDYLLENGAVLAYPKDLYSDILDFTYYPSRIGTHIEAILERQGLDKYLNKK